MTNKFNNILWDMINSKLCWVYRVYMKKNNLPELYTNISYYGKEVKSLLEQRSTEVVDDLAAALLKELTKQATTAKGEDVTYTYYKFKNLYGDPQSNSDIGKVYNNHSIRRNDNGDIEDVTNDGWVLIKKLLQTAQTTGVLPLAWIDHIGDLLSRAKLIAGRKPIELSTKDRKKVYNWFIKVPLAIAKTIDGFGEEPILWGWDYDNNMQPRTMPITMLKRIVFGYHHGPSLYLGNLNKPGNHFGMEWEIDCKTEMNFSRACSELIAQGLMWKDGLNNTKEWLIVPMNDSSVYGGFPVEFIFAPDSLEGFCETLTKVKAIFAKYDIKSSTEVNHSGIHITVDYDYLLPEATYLFTKYICHGMSESEYYDFAQRIPNGYCYRDASTLNFYLNDYGTHYLDIDELEDTERHSCLNFTLASSNRLECRMFNSSVDPVVKVKKLAQIIDYKNELAKKLQAKIDSERKVGA